MPNEHTWKETTEDGEKREVRATKFALQWRLQSKLKGDLQWTYHDKPTRADFETLRDLIFRKYQRKRASFDDLKSLDDILARLPPAPPSPAKAADADDEDEDV